MKILNCDDDLYPQKLLEIKDYPTTIYVEGNVELLNKRAVAIIGSRHSSEYGNYYAKLFAEELSKSGICIVSGLALGIDTMAHVGSMKNIGRTIAVLGSGFNNVFPYRNRGLFKKIIENNGCVISEYAPDAVTENVNFPRRNRIVSGLSKGVLVIESAYRSGTSITARLAVKQGRKLFCIPHNLDSTNGVGVNNLVKNGANLVTSSEDILAKLGWLVKSTNESKEKKQYIQEDILEEIDMQKINVDNKYLPIYKELSYDPININEICRNLNLSFNEVNFALTLLELEGNIEKLPGNQVVLKNN